MLYSKNLFMRICIFFLSLLLFSSVVFCAKIYLDDTISKAHSIVHEAKSAICEIYETSDKSSLSLLTQTVDIYSNEHIVWDNISFSLRTLQNLSTESEKILISRICGDLNAYLIIQQDIKDTRVFHDQRLSKLTLKIMELFSCPKDAMEKSKKSSKARFGTITSKFQDAFKRLSTQLHSRPENNQHLAEIATICASFWKYFTHSSLIVPKSDAGSFLTSMKPYISVSHFFEPTISSLSLAQFSTTESFQIKFAEFNEKVKELSFETVVNAFSQIILLSMQLISYQYLKFKNKCILNEALSHDKKILQNAVKLYFTMAVSSLCAINAFATKDEESARIALKYFTINSTSLIKFLFKSLCEALPKQSETMSEFIRLLPYDNLLLFITDNLIDDKIRLYQPTFKRTELFDYPREILKCTIYLQETFPHIQMRSAIQTNGYSIISFLDINDEQPIDSWIAAITDVYEQEVKSLTFMSDLIDVLPTVKEFSQLNFDFGKDVEFVDPVKELQIVSTSLSPPTISLNYIRNIAISKNFLFQPIFLKSALYNTSSTTPPLYIIHHNVQAYVILQFFSRDNNNLIDLLRYTIVENIKLLADLERGPYFCTGIADIENPQRKLLFQLANFCKINGINSTTVLHIANFVETHFPNFAFLTATKIACALFYWIESKKQQTTLNTKLQTITDDIGMQVNSILADIKKPLIDSDHDGIVSYNVIGESSGKQILRKILDENELIDKAAAVLALYDKRMEEEKEIQRKAKETARMQAVQERISCFKAAYLYSSLPQEPIRKLQYHLISWISGHFYTSKESLHKVLYGFFETLSQKLLLPDMKPAASTPTKPAIADLVKITLVCIFVHIYIIDECGYNCSSDMFEKLIYLLMELLEISRQKKSTLEVDTVRFLEKLYVHSDMNYFEEFSASLSFTELSRLFDHYLAENIGFVFKFRYLIYPLTEGVIIKKKTTEAAGIEPINRTEKCIRKTLWVKNYSRKLTLLKECIDKINE